MDPIDCPGRRGTGRGGKGEGNALHIPLLPFTNNWAQDQALATQRAVEDALSQAAQAMQQLGTTMPTCKESTTCKCDASYLVELGTPTLTNVAGPSVTVTPTGTVPLGPASPTPMVGGSGAINPGVSLTEVVAQVQWWLYYSCSCSDSKPFDQTRPGLNYRRGVQALCGNVKVHVGGDSFDTPCESPFEEAVTYQRFSGDLQGTDLAKAEAQVEAQARKDMAAALADLADCSPSCPQQAVNIRIFPTYPFKAGSGDGVYTEVTVRWFVQRVCCEPK